MNITQIQKNYSSPLGSPFQNLRVRFQAFNWEIWFESLPIMDVRGLPFLDLLVLYLANPLSAFFSELFLELKNIKNEEFIENLSSLLRLFIIATSVYFGYSFLVMLSTNTARLLYRFVTAKNLTELQTYSNMNNLTLILIGVMVYTWIVAQYWYLLKIILSHKNKTSLYITMITLAIFSTLYAYFYREQWSIFQSLLHQAAPNWVNLIHGSLYALILLLPAAFYLFWAIIALMTWIGCTLTQHASSLVRSTEID